MSSRLSLSCLETAPEALTVRMPLIALLLFTAGASAQTEMTVPASASADPPGAVVQPIPRSTL